MNCSYVSLNQILEPAEGDDPTTYGLQNHCSTNVSYTGKNSTHVVLRPNAIKRLLYVSKMAVWTGLEPVVRNFSRRVMELKSRLELESSHLELLCLSYFNTARCITILRTTHPNKSKTRLVDNSSLTS